MSKSEVRDAEDPVTSPARLADLAALENLPGVRERVAANPSTPVEVLRQLANSGVRGAVARNPSTPVEVLTRLADDPEWTVRGPVGTNPLTLASDPEEL